jgi:hypothetical protein
MEAENQRVHAVRDPRRAVQQLRRAGFLVDQLERAEYVRRVPDPNDGPARLVQIADRGAAVIEVARVAEAGVDAHLDQAPLTSAAAAPIRLRTTTDPYR